MSDIIGTARSLLPGGLLNLLTGGATWRGMLVTASFRGAEFGVCDHSFESGRRVAVYPFPMRDEIVTEDLGRAIRRMHITAFVLGDDYFAARDALLRACTEDSSPGTLSHPFLGTWQARCEICEMEEAAEAGGVATFTLTFVEAGGQQQKFAEVSTASALFKTVGAVLSMARSAAALVFATKNLGDFVQQAAGSMLGGIAESLAARFLGLPGLDLRQIQTAIDGLGTVDVTDPVATAAAVAAPYAAVAVAAAAVLPAPSGATGGDAIGTLVTSSRGEATPRAFWAGQVLLAAADAGDAPAPLSGAGGVLAAQVAANQSALAGLCGDAAVLAAAQLFAGTDFASADEAAAVKSTLVDAINARMDAAADAGADTLFAGWRALLAGLQADDLARSPTRPRLRPYAVPAPMPSLALAQRLYGDARHADALVALNNAIHPAFMPVSGVAESA